jgi:hypothetical protein
MFDQSSLAILAAWSFCSKQEERAKGMMVVALSFYMPQSLTTWGLRLYFTSEGRCAAVLYLPRPGLNPRTLVPVTSS